MTQVTSQALSPHKPTDIVSIDTIKKAFIEQHQLPAANQTHGDELADPYRVEAIKRTIAPLEKMFNTRVNVVAQAIPEYTRHGSIQIHQGEATLVATGIHNDQQTHQQFYLAVVGLLAIPRYLSKKGDKFVKQIYQCISEEQKALIMSLHPINDACKETEIVSQYLAHLASMNLIPSFHDRRNSFQRSLVRLCYAKLKWTNLDLHYLILQTKKKWIKNKIK